MNIRAVTYRLLIVATLSASVLQASFGSWARDEEKKAEHRLKKTEHRLKKTIDSPKNTARYEYDTAAELTPVTGIGAEIVASKHITINNLSGQAIEVNLLKKNGDTILSIGQEVSVPKNISYTTGVIDSDHISRNPLNELEKIQIHYVRDNETKTYHLTKTDKTHREKISKIDVHAPQKNRPFVTAHH